MKEVFQNYSHYLQWIKDNWNKSNENNSIIIKSGLVSPHFDEFILSASGFKKKELTGFIEIPEFPKKKDLGSGSLVSGESY